MAKKIFRGWIGKSCVGNMQSLQDDYSGTDNLFDSVFKTKGKKSDWDSNDWPPAQVKVTVETI